MKTRAPSCRHMGSQEQLRALPATAKQLWSYSSRRKGWRSCLQVWELQTTARSNPNYSKVLDGHPTIHEVLQRPLTGKSKYWIPRFDWNLGSLPMVLAGGDLQHQPKAIFPSFSLDDFHLLVRRSLSSKDTRFHLLDVIESAFFYKGWMDFRSLNPPWLLTQVFMNVSRKL